MKKTIMLTLLFAIFFCTSFSFAADRICGEDFESVTPGPVPEINPTGSGDISRAARTFWGRAGVANGGFLASGGNPGKCAMAYVGPYLEDSSYSEPKWRFDNKLSGSKEIYIKFDFRIDPNLGTSNGSREIYNFKLFLITSHTDASSRAHSHWAPQLNITPSSSSYSWYTWSIGGCYGEYYFSRATVKRSNHMMDNNWHTYEIYVHIGNRVANDKYDPNADGIVRLWEDGILILEDTSVPFRCSSSEGQGINSMAFIRHAKSLGAPVANMSGNLYFDNLEVWDGMKTGPNSPKNLRIVPTP